MGIAQMKITSVNIFVQKYKNPVHAFANVTMDDSFVIRGLAIKRKFDGTYYVTMPEFPRKDPSIQNCVAFPTNDNTRKEIEYAVLKAYNNRLENSYA